MHILLYNGFQLKNHEVLFSYTYNSKLYEIAVESDVITDKVPTKLLDHYGLAMSLRLFNVEDFDEIRLESMHLSSEQIEFFEWYFVHGMAEHRYTNGIDPAKPIKVRSETDKNSLEPLKSPNKHSEARYLSMIGGGKDSLVGLEILNRLGVEKSFFGVNTNYPSMAILKDIGEENNLVNFSTSQRPDVVYGQKYSGHKPGSSFWAFGSVIAAYVTGKERVVVANEWSANFPQLYSGGFPINHQFTKSLEFEKRFTEYVQKYLLESYEYFSIVRPLYEIQIAKIFSKLNKYHALFISCNIDYKEGRWCENCPKCAFVFAVLAPFLSNREMQTIWSTNLFSKEFICKDLYDLASENISPLECVGTPDETRIALFLAYEKHLLDDAHPDFKDKLVALARTVSKSEVENIMSAYNEALIPSDISSQIKDISLSLLS